MYNVDDSLRVICFLNSFFFYHHILYFQMLHLTEVLTVFLIMRLLFGRGYYLRIQFEFLAADNFLDKFEYKHVAHVLVKTVDKFKLLNTSTPP
jgi:hypothetical protein